VPTTEEIAVVLARLETKLDQALAHNEDHEKRLRKLETLVWKAMGAAAVLGVVGSQAVKMIIGG